MSVSSSCTGPVPTAIAGLTHTSSVADRSVAGTTIASRWHHTVATVRQLSQPSGSISVMALPLSSAGQPPAASNA